MKCHWFHQNVISGTKITQYKLTKSTLLRTPFTGFNSNNRTLMCVPLNECICSEKNSFPFMALYKEAIVHLMMLLRESLLFISASIDSSYSGKACWCQNNSYLSNTCHGSIKQLLCTLNALLKNIILCHACRMFYEWAVLLHLINLINLNRYRFFYILFAFQGLSKGTIPTVVYNVSQFGNP